MFVSLEGYMNVLSLKLVWNMNVKRYEYEC